MRFKRLSKLQWFGLVIFALVAIHILFFRAPSEPQMLAKFHQRKAEFEQIRLMLKQDKNVAIIAEDWERAKNSAEKDGVEMHELPLNISPERVTLYRSRLKSLGLSKVIVDKERVQFPQFGGGFGGDTWAIGYVWSEKSLKPLVKSAYHAYPNRGQVHYSPIAGNWYLYHRH